MNNYISPVGPPSKIYLWNYGTIEIILISQSHVIVDVETSLIVRAHPNQYLNIHWLETQHIDVK